LELLTAIGAAAQASDFGAWARQSDNAYPVANLIHLLGLVLLVGGIGIVDLRIAGFLRALPIKALSATLTPLALVGLALMALSGPVLFAADGVSLAASAMFRTKLLLIALALANAAAFRLLWRGRLNDPPPVAKAMAVASLLLWLSVGALGRMIAYS
jgi:hypothetical protein